MSSRADGLAKAVWQNGFCNSQPAGAPVCSVDNLDGVGSLARSNWAGGVVAGACSERSPNTTRTQDRQVRSDPRRTPVQSTGGARLGERAAKSSRHRSYDGGVGGMSPPGLADRNTVDKPPHEHPVVWAAVHHDSETILEALDSANFYGAKREKIATRLPKRWAAELSADPACGLGRPIQGCNGGSMRESYGGNHSPGV